MDPPTSLPPPQFMDPSTATSDPAVNVSSSPTPAVVPVPNHPSYSGMIVEAINVMKEKDGSSKQAIAKYIDRVYSKSNLPATHSSLLTHHLKRLKDSGVLVMAKQSYKVAARSAPQGQAQANGTKRSRGRPSKASKVVENCSSVNSPPVQHAEVNRPAVHESVFASLGLVDVPSVEQKRRPGRPPKAAAAGGGSQQDTPLMKLMKKSPGRPSKAKIGSNSVGAASFVAKKRGRPKKNTGAAAKPINVAVPTQVDGISAGVVSIPVSPTGKKRGRPPKVGVGSNEKPRNLSGKPLGRPKKSASATAGQVSNVQQLLTYQELKKKFEFFQSRIKQTISLLKPCLGSQTPATALAALQELDELGAIDATGPINIQVQENQPPPNQSS